MSSMDGMHAMHAAGGAISMVWMRAPDQTWFGAAASFVGMWVVMMTPMMAPSFAPTLWRYHQAARAVREGLVGWNTALAAAGYFLVWTVLGAAVFPLGAALVAIATREPALTRLAPIAVGGVSLVGGALQFSSWKARELALCREMPRRHATFAVDSGEAWRYGLCVGVHCVRSCAGLTAVLLVSGMTDLRVMISIAAAITAERVAPNGLQVARSVGGVVFAAAVYLMVSGVRLA